MDSKRFSFSQNTTFLQYLYILTSYTPQALQCSITLFVSHKQRLNKHQQEKFTSTPFEKKTHVTKARRAMAFIIHYQVLFGVYENCE